MAYYFFVKDFRDGKIAESLIADNLRAKDYNVEELELDRQIEGDLEVFNLNERFTVEVKFDRMAKSTGNLCFEMANSKGLPTGIASTQADRIVYIVPETDKSVQIFWFETKRLRKWLNDPLNASKIRVVQGGDRKAYTLMIVSKKTIFEDRIMESMETINAELHI